jgi:hypothetical protein
MTPTTRRMKEGMTGVKAPQVLFEVESVILLHLERLSPEERDIAMSKPRVGWLSNSARLFWSQQHLRTEKHNPGPF